MKIEKIKILFLVVTSLLIPLQIFTLYSGIMFFITVALISLFVWTAFLFNEHYDYTYSEAKQVQKYAKIAFSQLIIFAIIVICLFFMTTVQTHTETETYNIYHVTAPFGILWTDTSGSFVFATGHIQTDLRETYTVKYLDNNNLYTIHLDALKTQPIIDGQFIIEKTIKITEITHPIWDWKNYQSRVETGIYIHLPVLPEQDSITREYRIK